MARIKHNGKIVRVIERDGKLWEINEDGHFLRMLAADEATPAIAAKMHKHFANPPVSWWSMWWKSVCCCWCDRSRS